jgi:hypothetical protein
MRFQVFLYGMTMTNSVASDKRRFHRFNFNGTAALTSPNAHIVCSIVDLSLNGCLLELMQDWQYPSDQQYTLSFRLSPDVVIAMDCTVAHVDGHRVGLRCVHIDLESISNLRRMAELNLGNPALLERDLQALIHA